ncbi:MAG: RNA polymerase-binding protein DksA [Gammaproteobacteria bacterium]|jgi:DnaK suppressor protein
MAAKKKKAVKKKAVKKAAKKATTKSKTAKKKATAKKKVVKKAAAKKKAVKKAAPKKKVAKKKPAKKAAAPKAKTKKAPAKPKPKKKPAAKVKPALGEDLGYTDFAPYEITKGEEYMNDEQKAHFRELLNSWKSELMAKVDETVHHMQDEAANFPDPNDRATQESDFTMELRTRDRERKLIKKIDESLALLDNDEYGYCESCGVEIGVRRLEARPTATECIDCKSLNEIKEKQYGK